MKFYSNGKLLLTGEYLVLDGAPAIALPTKFGQSLEVQEANDRSSWKSYDREGNCWFSMEFDLADVLANRSDITDDLEKKIVRLLQEMYRMNAHCFPADNYQFTTKMDFDRNWGLGTSSTLVNNLAQFANIDPYQLLQKSFGGSGYDIACAQADQPILYQDGSYQNIDLPALLRDHLYFVYLNRKQNSREAIRYYRNLSTDKYLFIKQLKNINRQLLCANRFEDARKCMTEHEKMIGNLLRQETVKERLFPELNAAVKSLGAWGGDFVAVLADHDIRNYFMSKGYSTVFTYEELIKSSGSSDIELI